MKQGLITRDFLWAGQGSNLRPWDYESHARRRVAAASSRVAWWVSDGGVIGHTNLPPRSSAIVSKGAPRSQASSLSSRKRHLRDPGRRRWGTNPCRVNSCTVRTEHRRRLATSGVIRKGLAAGIEHLLFGIVGCAFQRRRSDYLPTERGSRRCPNRQKVADVARRTTGLSGAGSSACAGSPSIHGLGGGGEERRRARLC